MAMADRDVDAVPEPVSEAAAASTAGGATQSQASAGELATMATELKNRVSTFTS
jgi:hypothetical protein